MEYAQIPLQLQLSTASSPSIPPIDNNTGQAPSFWRAQPVALNVGIFDAQSNPVNLANISSLQVAIYANAGDLYPVISVSVPNSDPSWSNLITTAGWEAATQANATLGLTPAQTDQCLQGAASASFWMVVTGIVTANGAVITYGAGAITIVNSGSQVGVLTAPAPTLSTLSNGAGNSTITITSMIHTAIATITGGGGTRELIIGTAGFSSLFTGAQLDVLLKVPATAGIVLEFFDTSLSGVQVADFTTDGSGASQCVRFVYDGTQWQYKSSSP